MTSNTPRTDAVYLTAEYPALCRQLERALAKYKNAEMPKEPIYFRSWLSTHKNEEDIKYIEDLLTFAAAATVRAGEAEKRLQFVYDRRNATGITLIAPLLYPTYEEWIEGLDAVLQSGGKE